MRFLVVKFDDLGGVLTITPALRALREAFPQATIDVLLTARAVPVLEGSPLVDRLLPFDKFRYDTPWRAFTPGSLRAVLDLCRGLRARRYDVLLLCHHLTTRWGTLKFAALVLASGAPRRIGLDNGRGWFLTDRVPDQGFGACHEAEYWLALAACAGADGRPRPLENTYSPADAAMAARLLEPVHRPTVAIHPGSGRYSLARRWPADRFARLADRLVEAYRARIVLVGGPEEQELGETVAGLMRTAPLNLVGRTTVKQLAALLARVDLFIGNDSGVMHLAAAVGTPVVAIFGLSNHRAWGPYDGAGGKRHTVVRVDLPCSPCFYRGHRLGWREGCATRDCLDLISPEMVVAAAARYLRPFLSGSPG